MYPRTIRNFNAFIDGVSYFGQVLDAKLPALMLALASAGATDLGTTADIASNILSGFALDASEMGRVGDVLTNAFTTSNTNLQMLGETMSYVAPNATAAGISLETVAAMTGKLGDAGIQGSRAGTALNAMISRLAAPVGGAADALERLGIETADTDGNLRPIIDVLGEMNAAMADLGTAEQATLRKAIFGEEASGAAEVLMIQAGSGALQEYARRMDEQGSAARVAEQQNDNFAGMLKQVGSVTEALSITIGTMMLPALSEFARELVPLIESVNAWAEANPEIVLALGQMALWLGGITAASMVARLAIVAFLSPVRLVLGILGRLFIMAAWLNPWTWIAAAVVAAAYVIYDNSDNIVEYFRDKFDRIKAAFDEGWVQGVVQVLKEFNPITLLADAMVGLAVYLGEQAAGWLQDIDDRLTGFSLYDSGKAMIQTLWDGAKSIVGQMVADIKARITGILPEWLLTYIGADTGGAAAEPAVDTSPPISRGRGRGDTTNVDVGGITVIAQPGQSTEAIAAEVGREFDRRGRATAQPLYDTAEDAQ